MNNDHSALALTLSWIGLVGSWLTMSHVLGVLTGIFTALQIILAVRKLRQGQA